MRQKIIIITITLAVSVVIGLMGAVASRVDTTPVADNASSNGATPRMSVSQTTFDLGTMPVSEERVGNVLITNTGDAPLELKRIRTSCNCTLAELTIDGRVMTFSMDAHNPIGLRTWVGVLAPGASATMRAIYRPFVMPVQGPVERKIWFDTNDPAQKTVTVTLQAFVQK